MIVFQVARIQSNPKDCLAGVVMLIEIPLILGLCSPALILLAAVSLVLHSLVFGFITTFQGISIKRPIEPPTQYLWVSLCLGCALLSWFYVLTGLSSQWLVVIGMPACALAAVMFPRLRYKGRAATDHGRAAPTREDTLRVPLLDEIHIPGGVATESQALNGCPEARGGEGGNC